MEDRPPRPNKLRGWWGIVALVVACLLIVLAVFFWWYHSTADLEQIRAEAKKRGIPTTWAEAGVVASPPDVVAKFERLGVLSNQLKDYDSLVVTGKAGANRNDRLLPFLPIPAAAMDHHAKLDPTLVAEYLDLLDHLPQLPIISSVERTYSSRLPVISIVRSAMRYQGERILLAPVAELSREVERGLHLLNICESRSQIELLVQVSCVAILHERIAARLPDLRSVMPDLPQRLDQLVDRFGSQTITSFAGEFILTFQTSEHLDQMNAVGGLGYAAVDYDWVGRLLVRAGRSTLLTHEMTWIEMARRTSALRDRVANANLVQADAKRLRRWLPSEFLTLMTIHSIPMIQKMIVHSELSVRLLAAELRGETWPTDPFDPSGSPLRRLERDGKVVGGYSVDENGVDDGGRKGKDRYFPLYGPLTPPAPATTTPAP